MSSAVRELDVLSTGGKVGSRLGSDLSDHSK